MPRPRTRPRLRDVVQLNATYLKQMGASATDIDAIHARTQQYLPKPRAKRTQSDPADLEAPVKAAIADLLAKHPRVLFAVRQNSGAAWSQVKAKQVPIYFYKLLTGQPVTITDFWGFLKDGRAFAIEAKKPSFTEPRTEREFKQAAFMQLIRNIGGVGGFARSAEGANDILS